MVTVFIWGLLLVHKSIVHKWEWMNIDFIRVAKFVKGRSYFRSSNHPFISYRRRIIRTDKSRCNTLKAYTLAYSTQESERVELRVAGQKLEGNRRGSDRVTSTHHNQRQTDDSSFVVFNFFRVP